MQNVYWSNSTYFLYLVMSLIGMYLLGRVVQCNNHKMRVRSLENASFLLIVIWTFVATSRLVSFNIGGSDAITYIDIFKRCNLNTFDPLLEHCSDPVFLWLNKVIRYVTPNYHMYFAIVYGFIAYSFALFVKKISSPFACIVPLIMVFYLYLRGFNTLRTNLVIAFVMVGLVSIYDKCYWRAYLFCLCACLCHKAGIVFSMVVPFAHYTMMKNVKICYVIIAAVGLFLIGSTLRDYFINYASNVDLGGSYGHYAEAAKEDNNLLAGATENFLQYALALIVLIFSKSIQKSLKTLDIETATKVRFLLGICYFDIILMPFNAIMGIWRGYEFFMLPRICLWGYLLYFLYRNRVYSKDLVYFVSFIIVVGWFTFRLNRTYVDSCLMPYIFNLF